MATKYEKLLKQYEEHCQQIIRVCTVDKTESQSEQIQRIKKLEKNYKDWFEYYLEEYASCECADFHVDIANFVIKNPICKALLDIFRGGAKSVHACIGIPLYLYLAKKEMWFMLLVGENSDKAIKLLSDIQANLKHNQRIINDYGAKFQQGDWSEGNFTTSDGVHFRSLGFGQDPSGLRHGNHRPDYIACDDIDNLRRCNNDRLIREGMDYITGTLWGCFDKGKERFVFSNNLKHKNSFMAKLQELAVKSAKESKVNKTNNPYRIFKVKAVVDEESFTPTWPQKYDAQYWRDKRGSTPYRSWMREYMCTPLVEGSIFKPEWMQYKRVLPLRLYDALCFYGDLSYKDKGDYKAMLLVGKKGREFHVIYAFVRQTSRANVAVWLYDLYEKQKLPRYNIRYLIEGLFAQDEFVNDFDTEGDMRGYHIPVVADKKSKEGKYDRIEGITGHFERRKVFFNEKAKLSPDMTLLKDQLLAFEKGSGANDDAPDALQSAIKEVNQASFTQSFDPIIIPRSERKNNRI